MLWSSAAHSSCSGSPPHLFFDTLYTLFKQLERCQHYSVRDPTRLLERTPAAVILHMKISYLFFLFFWNVLDCQGSEHFPGCLMSFTTPSHQSTLASVSLFLSFPFLNNSSFINWWDYLHSAVFFFFLCPEHSHPSSIKKLDCPNIVLHSHSAGSIIVVLFTLGIHTDGLHLVVLDILLNLQKKKKIICTFLCMADSSAALFCMFSETWREYIGFAGVIKFVEAVIYYSYKQRKRDKKKDPRPKVDNPLALSSSTITIHQAIFYSLIVG